MESYKDKPLYRLLVKPSSPTDTVLNIGTTDDLIVENLINGRLNDKVKHLIIEIDAKKVNMLNKQKMA